MQKILFTLMMCGFVLLLSSELGADQSRGAFRVNPSSGRTVSRGWVAGRGPVNGFVYPAYPFGYYEPYYPPVVVISPYSPSYYLPPAIVVT